ncbi:MAG: hypothetical protein HC835_01870 [Oscillatoriales cyanobacterium RM2_1_1]|nr:hypothetical protein [Oscillatoriales cyanobacterium SM2_3_0]NJO44472.1 hypothetical protein [Oscillatoriales cyanobacterium RM2_1_1]
MVSLPSPPQTPPEQSVPRLLRSVSVAAVLASLGLHALIGFNIEKLPLFPETADLPPTVELLELSPEQVQGVYPEPTRLVPSPFKIPRSLTLPLFGSQPTTSPPPLSTLPFDDSFTSSLGLPRIGNESSPFQTDSPEDFPNRSLAPGPNLPNFSPPPDFNNQPPAPPPPVNPFLEWVRTIQPKYPELKGIAVVKNEDTNCRPRTRDLARLAVVVDGEGKIIAGPDLFEKTGNEDLDTAVWEAAEKFLAGIPAAEFTAPYSAYGFEFRFNRANCSEDAEDTRDSSGSNGEGIGETSTSTDPDSGNPNQPDPTSTTQPAPINPDCTKGSILCDLEEQNSPGSDGENTAPEGTSGSGIEQSRRGAESLGEYFVWVQSLQESGYADLETSSPQTITDFYPAEACAQKLEGQALIGVVVGPDGAILEGPEVLYLQGDPLLSRAALQRIQEVPGDPLNVPVAYQYGFEFNSAICGTPSSPGQSVPGAGAPNSVTPIQPTEPESSRQPASPATPGETPAAGAETSETESDIPSEVEANIEAETETETQAPDAISPETEESVPEPEATTEEADNSTIDSPINSPAIPEP